MYSLCVIRTAAPWVPGFDLETEQYHVKWYLETHLAVALTV